MDIMFRDYLNRSARQTRIVGSVCFLMLFLLLTACAGTDSLRVASDRANHRLATRCADGWFQSLPATEQDQRLVRNALADWEAAIKADEAIVGGGGK